MTNVPAGIREIWTDLYKLFDVYYLAETPEQWLGFWADVNALYHKHGENDRIYDAAIVIAQCIGISNKGG